MLKNRARQGVALPITLLVAALVLSAFVTIAGVSALASRAATTAERASIQALLVAESGLDTLAPRSVAAGVAPPAVYEVADLQTWLTQSGLASHQVGTGVAELTVVAADADRTAFTVRSRGALGNARTDVMSEFRVSSTTRRARINVPAALTSYPVVITGTPNNISIEGVSIENASGVISGAVVLEDSFSVVAGNPGPYRLQLDEDSVGILVDGDFLSVDGRTLEVVSVDGQDLSLVQIEPDPVTASEPIGVMDQIKVGLAEDFPLGSRSFRVNNPDRLFELGLIKVGDAIGVVESIVDDVVTVVSWTPIGGPSDHPRGTAIVSEVYGIYTADAYQAHNQGEATDSWVEFGTLPDPNAEGEDSLFFQTFGVTKEEFFSSVGAENTFANANDMPLPLTGQTVLVQDHNLQNAICGTGTVVIDGDAVFNAGQACPDGQDFRGLLYVMGDLRMQGNVVMTGAVVVEGSVDADPDDTVVQGSGNEGTRIAYDEAALRDATRNFPSPGGLERVAGTWRQ